MFTKEAMLSQPKDYVNKLAGLHKEIWQKNRYRQIFTTRTQCLGIDILWTFWLVTVQPLRLGLENVADDYKNLLDNFPKLTLCPITRDVTLQAAVLRAKYGLRTPDALILATWITQGATLMITNDIQWKQVSEIQIVCLKDLKES